MENELVEKCLLTEGEIREIPFYYLTPQKALPYALQRKVLCKAIPIIQKAERERIVREIEEFNKHKIVEGHPVLEFVAGWSTLKGETNDKPTD